MGGEGGCGAGGRRKGGSRAGTHLVDPVDVGGHAREDRGLLAHVAAEPGAKADNAPHLPGAVLSLAVQRAAGVPLHQTRRVSAPRPPPEAGLGSREVGGGALRLGTPVLASGFHGEGGRDDVVGAVLALGYRLGVGLLCDLGIMTTLSVPRSP